VVVVPKLVFQLGHQIAGDVATQGLTASGRSILSASRAEPTITLLGQRSPPSPRRRHIEAFRRGAELASGMSFGVAHFIERVFLEAAVYHAKPPGFTQDVREPARA
jgi:hypothetical protein